MEKMKRREIENRVESILDRFVSITAIPAFIGGIINQIFGYNFVYAAGITAVIFWGIKTEIRIQDLQRKVFGGKYGKK